MNWRILMVILLSALLAAGCVGGSSGGGGGNGNGGGDGSGDGGDGGTGSGDPVSPTADAGTNQIVFEGDEVTLSGTGSSAPDGESITSYAWTQTSGSPTVTLTGADQVSATFTAPDVSANTDLAFELTVTADNGEDATDSVTVTVQPMDAQTVTGTVMEPNAALIQSMRLVRFDNADGAYTESVTLDGSFDIPGDETFTINLAEGDPKPPLHNVMVEATTGEGNVLRAPFITDTDLEINPASEFVAERIENSVGSVDEMTVAELEFLLDQPAALNVDTSISSNNTALQACYQDILGDGMNRLAQVFTTAQPSDLTPHLGESRSMSSTYAVLGREDGDFSRMRNEGFDGRTTIVENTDGGIGSLTAQFDQRYMSSTSLGNPLGNHGLAFAITDGPVAFDAPAYIDSEGALSVILGTGVSTPFDGNASLGNALVINRPRTVDMGEVAGSLGFARSTLRPVGYAETTGGAFDCTTLAFQGFGNQVILSAQHNETPPQTSDMNGTYGVVGYATEYEDGTSNILTWGLTGERTFDGSGSINPDQLTFIVDMERNDANQGTFATDSAGASMGPTGYAVDADGRLTINLDSGANDGTNGIVFPGASGYATFGAINHGGGASATAQFDVGVKLSDSGAPDIAGNSYEGIMLVQAIPEDSEEFRLEVSDFSISFDAGFTGTGSTVEVALTDTERGFAINYGGPMGFESFSDGPETISVASYGANGAIVFDIGGDALRGFVSDNGDHLVLIYGMNDAAAGDLEGGLILASRTN